jgi:hypothetical protein
MESKAVRLTDGELVVDGGDLVLFWAVQLSLQAAPSDEGFYPFCEQGTFPTLAEVTTNEVTCSDPPGVWTTRLFLSGATSHSDEESHVIGLGALVRSVDGTGLYRLRILGDAVSPPVDGSLGTATVTFEYDQVRQLNRHSYVLQPYRQVAGCPLDAIEFLT